jgi:hypothetical protein
LVFTRSPGRLGFSDGDHAALLAEPAQQSIDAVAAWSGFIAEAELPVAALQALDETMQRLRRARDLAQKANFTAAASFGDHAARLLYLRLGAGQSGATLDHGIPETGPSAQQGEHRV